MQTTLPAHLLSHLSDVLATHTGLHFPAERWGDLERGIGTAAPALGMADAESCAQRLVSLPLTHREIEILASHLTVGETYFFREKQSFEVLEQHILPALLRKREESGQRLRIWSAGCCTGEEPYSIAMLLDRMIPRRDTWNITLLATDINPLFLHKAVEGKYGEWSFRSTPGWIRERYFRPGKKGEFKLDTNIRQRVTFSYLNLADDAYPSLTNNTNAMDIIFCRNVLMYFSAERARKVIGNFHRALVDGGWLIVSPAEASSSLFSSFTTVNLGGAILYRKDVGATAELLPTPAPPADFMPASRHFSAEHTPVEVILAPHVSTTIPLAESNNNNTPTAPSLDAGTAARDCANQGRLSEAAEWCRKAISINKLNPGHHYLLAIIQQEQGQHNDAAQSLMRALYLDPGFVLAHYALGNLCHAQGKHHAAERHFDNALDALRTYSPDVALPEADGLTAGRLAEIIEAMRPDMPQLAAHH